MVDIKVLHERLFKYYAEIWKNEIVKFPKLRSYILFKDEFCTEDYVKMDLTRRERSLLCQTRLGILPLRIETGRYVNEQIEDRICLVCNKNEIENENHFIFECDTYEENRAKFKEKNVNVSSIEDLKECNIRSLAKFINLSFEIRKQKIYIEN